MAALVQGVQYGLSSQGNFHENKSLIFVKLTDSAYRAIEDFLRNKNKTCQHPTIQFLGNEGHLSFPSSEPSHAHAGFNFSLSSNADVEGPQGSFECIQQTSSKSLESLGALPCKMRIQAKDDVYEATRYRMAVAEENHKKNCTREIKPGGPGIGKKVKVKNPIIPIRRDREPANSLGPSATQLKHYSPKPSNGYVSSSHHGVVNGNVVPNMAHTKPQGDNHAQKPGNPDILRRPLKERLIHLLAVRPYKKPELYERIKRDGGMKDKDKNNLTTILKQVAVWKDNSYQLIRHVWNDVQEDWPFYSEQEKQFMKRQKPQNLTPPGSSDGGSSGSGQSPTSTHPGSPPSTISSSSNMKRPGYIDGADGLPTKRQRISHYRTKPTEQASITNRLPDSSQQRSTPADSSSRSDDFYRRNDKDRSREAMNSNSRREYGSSRGCGGGGELLLRNNGYSNHHHNSVVSSATDGRCSSGPENEENDDKQSGTSVQGGSYNSVVTNKTRCETVASNSSGGSGVCSGTNVTSATVDDSSPLWNRTPENGVLSQSASSRSHGGHHDNRNSRWTTRVTSTTQNSSASGSSPESQLENLDTRREPEPKEKTSTSSTSEYPEYLLTYSSIRDSEQRRQYKADFTADYSEYRDLHAEVEKVSKRFAQLEERLRQEERYSTGWKEIKNLIVREYQENKRDLKFQEAKRRFQYLHEKLSHIKRLVLEYDSAVASGGDHY